MGFGGLSIALSSLTNASSEPPNAPVPILARDLGKFVLTVVPVTYARPAASTAMSVTASLSDPPRNVE